MSAAASSGESDDKASPASVRKVRIYTKTGDKGSSSLFNGQRRAKDDAIFEALGDVDELNANLGMAREHIEAARKRGGASGSDDASLAGIAEQLVEIQSRLLDLGSAIATPVDSSSPEQLARVAFPKDSSATLERWIDEADDRLPALRNFILPGGGLAAASLHVCRTVCRRAERRVVGLTKEGHAPAEVGIFLNRLSDYLFTVARLSAQAAKQEEKVYKKAAAAAATGGASS